MDRYDGSLGEQLAPAGSKYTEGILHGPCSPMVGFLDAPIALFSLIENFLLELYGNDSG